MFQKKGIRFRILLNSLISILIFSVFSIWLTNTYWNVLLNNKKEKLQNIVEVSSSLVKNYINMENQKILTHEEAIKRAINDINVIRYGGKEYVFITNSKAYQVLNPVKPELSGKDMSAFQDPNGFKLYVEIAKLALSSGSGFINYMFPKAGSTEPIKKISFITYFPEWDWIVGSGLYMDDIYNALMGFIQILLINCLVCIILLIFIGLLFASSIQKPLKEVCNLLLNSSHSLNEKSEQLKSSSSNITNYSNQQATSIQSIATAISEITNMIGKTTSLTTQSANLANDISTKAEEGEIVMKNMVSSMQGIYDASSKLKEIENIIKQIESKTQIITEIVAKTELLSLNASIEAARAGEYGKGFSVVAEEVGNLASSSGKSSNEIKELLQKSHEEVQKILEQTLAQVSEGRSRTMNVSDAFNKIVDGIKEINLQMGQISEATREQESGVKQIANAMTQLDQLAAKNTIESDNSLNSSKNIQQESENIKITIQKTEQVVFGSKK